ncbi:hypothetical protein D3C87_1077500 [compost metagenome]
MTVNCSKCGSPMLLRSHLTFSAGPGKLIFACTLVPNHVSIFEEKTALETIPPEKDA